MNPGHIYIVNFVIGAWLLLAGGASFAAEFQDRNASSPLRLSQTVQTKTPASDVGASRSAVPDYRIDTELTLDRIQESFASPETMSFWDLPEFIETLEAAGFSARKHRLHWHSILAGPLLLCAMVLIAATFSLRLTRRGLEPDDGCPEKRATMAQIPSSTTTPAAPP